MENKKNILTIAIIGILVVAVLILLVMVINSNKGITLTMNNYKDYMGVPHFSMSGTSNPRNLYISVNGVSENFNYEEVEVEVKLNGTYRIAKTKQYEYETIETDNRIITIKCNISGNGQEIVDTGIEVGNYQELSYEVVGVKGKLKPAGK